MSLSGVLKATRYILSERRLLNIEYGISGVTIELKTTMGELSTIREGKETITAWIPGYEPVDAVVTINTLIEVCTPGSEEGSIIVNTTYYNNSLGRFTEKFFKNFSQTLFNSLLQFEQVAR